MSSSQPLTENAACWGLELFSYHCNWVHTDAFSPPAWLLVMTSTVVKPREDDMVQKCLWLLSLYFRNRLYLLQPFISTAALQRFRVPTKEFCARPSNAHNSSPCRSVRVPPPPYSSEQIKKLDLEGYKMKNKLTAEWIWCLLHWHMLSVCQGGETSALLWFIPPSFTSSPAAKEPISCFKHAKVARL